MSSFNEKKFVFFETFTNQNGKTSGSGFIGVILGLLAIAAFAAAMVGYFLQLPETINVMEEILQIIMAVTVLLGVRKVSGDFREAKIAVKQADVVVSKQSEPVQPVQPIQPEPAQPVQVDPNIG